MAEPNSNVVRVTGALVCLIEGAGNVVALDRDGHHFAINQQRIPLAADAKPLAS